MLTPFEICEQKKSFKKRRLDIIQILIRIRGISEDDATNIFDASNTGKALANGNFATCYEQDTANAYDICEEQGWITDDNKDTVTRKISEAYSSIIRKEYI